ncbi:MAG: hypothetical protein JWL65_146 [Gammaproteobacteria bacterium]|nr:hypothetical protein [Gammaproteobacteria bacterium]
MFPVQIQPTLSGPTVVAIMATSVAGQRLREQVNAFMAAVPIPESTPAGEPPVTRADGVVEFYKHWTVRSTDSATGLYATCTDCDDVLEFGLTERQEGQTHNVLLATLVLTDDGGELNVISEANAELNLDAIVTPDNASPLLEALRYFGQLVRGD